MTTEEKARAYDEALRRAKAAIDIAADKDLVKGVVSTIFPELRESEDERIRKAIIELLKEVEEDETYTGRQHIPDMLSYLEKQKEQKSVVTHGETYHVDTLGTQQVIAGKMPQKPAEWNYDNRIQYDSVKSGVEAFASTYSFNIESKLFPQLTKEQQQLWRKEIEQAVIAGGEDGIELARDNRYKENRMIEWNEEDKSFYNSIMCEVVKEGMHPTPAQANWLKLLPERFNLQSKQRLGAKDLMLARSR